MRTIATVVFMVLLCGCMGTRSVLSAQERQERADEYASRALDLEIRKFNANTADQAGAIPIARRVAHIERGEHPGQLIAFDEDGEPFIVLELSSQGSFAGVIEADRRVPAAWAHEEGPALVPIRLANDPFGEWLMAVDGP
jgi:hypothetical protein